MIVNLYHVKWFQGGYPKIRNLEPFFANVFVDIIDNL